MYDFPIALQLYSVDADMNSDFEGTLKKVKELGYDGIEFAGLFGHSAAEVREMCEKIGLIPISAHVPYHEFEQGEDVYKTYSEIGCKYIVIPGVAHECHGGGKAQAEFYDSVKRFGELANRNGMRLCYHNHDFEFKKTNGEYSLDRLYRNVPKELLLTQLDTCWINVGGENPADYIRKYSGRAETVHLKDFTGSKSENMYALLGDGKDKNEVAKGSFEFRPLGMGVQDFPAILKASKDAGASWLIVEQDKPSLGKTPLECAKISIDYLRSIF